jgi:chromosome segregation ATPase
VEGGLDAKPTIEALENERRRLQELERNLAAERRRVQDTAAREIARMQTVLREAAERAAGRERELDATRKKLERKLEGGRIGRLAGFRERSAEAKEARSFDRRERLLAEQAEAMAVRTDELRAREAELEQKLEQLVDAERLSFEQLAERAAGVGAHEQALIGERGPVDDGQQAELQRQVETLADRQTEIEENEAVLARRTAELTEHEAALERRELELAARAQAPAPAAASPDLRAEQERFEAKALTLERADRALAEARAQISAREASVQRRQEAAQAQEAALAHQQEQLDDREARLDDVEPRAAALADRATVLDAREAELAETIAALEQRERELALLRDELDAERRRLAERSRRLAEVERSSPIRPAHHGRAVGFSEGIRELGRRRGAV